MLLYSRDRKLYGKVFPAPIQLPPDTYVCKLTSSHELKYNNFEYIIKQMDTKIIRSRTLLGYFILFKSYSPIISRFFFLITIDRIYVVS